MRDVPSPLAVASLAVWIHGVLREQLQTLHIALKRFMGSAQTYRCALGILHQKLSAFATQPHDTEPASTAVPSKLSHSVPSTKKKMWGW